VKSKEIYFLDKKYLPPRHKDTKDFILLFFPSGAEPLWGGALVSWCLWREEKSFATKNTKFTTKGLN
jgi:hypothetical protein